LSAKYSNAGEKGMLSTPQAEISVSPLAPAWAVFLGGVMGVLVVVLFKYLVMLNQPTAPSSTVATGESEGSTGVPIAAAVATARLKTAPTAVPRWWAAPALGMVVVLLSVILFRFTASQFPDLPITVSVKDIYGGFALGLVFHTLTDFFKNALKS
jgi:hypothetical protein